LDTGNTGNIGNLMGISHHRSATVGKYCSSKFTWHKEGAFQVKVAVNKSWGENGAIDFDNLLCLTVIKANNHAIEYGNGS
jgi:hypothetical protein